MQLITRAFSMCSRGRAANTAMDTCYRYPPLTTNAMMLYTLAPTFTSTWTSHDIVDTGV